MTKTAVFVLCLLAFPGHSFAKRNYRFDGSLSREVLENYLSRSITMTEMYRAPGNLDDDIRMLKNIGAKFAGRAIYVWGRESRLIDPEFWKQGRTMVDRLHRVDADIVLQSCLFEIVTEFLRPIFTRHWSCVEPGVSVDDAAEWVVRTILSLLTVRGPRERSRDGLRAFLSRFLLPAILASDHRRPV